MLVLWAGLAWPAPSAAPQRDVTTLTLLYFHASWCGSCARLDKAGVVASIQQAHPALRVEKVDVDVDAARLDRYGVTVTPTLVLVDQDGFQIGRPRIDLDDPTATVARVVRLVDRATGAAKRKP